MEAAAPADAALGGPGPRKLEEAGAGGSEQAAFLMMEEILEKLKMLDYEAKFRNFKPLTHTHFAVASSNPNEQFYYFMSLASWLMSLLGHSWKAPSQMDDPNSSAASLLRELQQIGAPTNYNNQKLKLGYGEVCCSVLKFLLEQINIDFKAPIYTEDQDVEEAAVDDEAEVDVPEMADEVGVAECVEEEFYHGGGGAEVAREPTKLTDTILEANVAPEAWRIELERVTPQLKMQVLSDPKEWRNRCAPTPRAPPGAGLANPAARTDRLVNTKSHQQTVEALAPETTATLERLAEDLDRTLQAPPDCYPMTTR